MTAESAKPEPAEGRRKSILVVDDSLTIRMQVKDLLEENGFKALLAENGETCLATIETQIPYAILLDIVMPGMNGIDVCKKIRADNKYKNVPILILTTQGNIDSKVKGLAAGADDYLTKPFEIEELMARLKAVFRTKELYDKLKSANQKIKEQQKSVVEEERLKVLLQMAGATAHELNQPLMILLANIEILMTIDHIPSEVSKYLSAIEDSGKRISEIVKTIQTIRHDQIQSYPGGKSIVDLH
ncbi:MAG: response regulator [Desulfobacteraceae bacterium]|nr:response regulator [Desulfobacteraceae bacterium]